MTAEIQGVLTEAEPPPRRPRVRIAMVSSLKERCGIADYTRYLVAELGKRIEVAWLVQPDDFAPVMNEADIVHVQHQYFLFGGVAPWRSTFKRFIQQIKAPLVMTVHEIVTPEGSPPRRLALTAANRANFRHSSVRAFIVHTEQDRSRLAECGVPPDRIHSIFHGVPPRPPLPDRSTARARLGLTDEFVLTVFGVLSRRKGHNLALDALAKLPPNVRLILAGGQHPDDHSDYVRELERRSADPAIGDRVSITGYLAPDEAESVMAATDLVLAPFISGSGSGSLAFAFACGKPILASAIPPHQEICRADPGAMGLFPPGNAQALAEAVLLAMRNARSRTRMTEGAQRYAARHGYDTMAEATISVYHQVIGAHTPCA